MQTIREQFERGIAKTVQSVEDGEFSAMEAMANLKEMQDFLKKSIDQIEDVAFCEFENECQGEKTIKNFKGFEVTKRNGGWSYDFSGVRRYSETKKLLKNMEVELKALFEHAQSVDPETGEVLDIKKKPRKDSISFKPTKER